MRGLEHGTSDAEQKMSSDVKPQADLKPPKEIGNAEHRLNNPPTEMNEKTDAITAPKELSESSIAEQEHDTSIDSQRTELSDNENDSRILSEPINSPRQIENNYSNRIIENRNEGLRRENEVKEELQSKYSAQEGYEIIREPYLRNENGEIVRDPETNEGRRVDFAVVKDGKIVDMIEVTSQSAPKKEQIEKEKRIRDAGGLYIKNSNDLLCYNSDQLVSRIDRRD